MTSGLAVSEKQLVVFGLAGETYGVDISMVKEIIQMQAITAVPGTASSVEGVTNLRGTVIPVVNLRKRFGLEAEEYDKKTRIVVINRGENQIGVIVDSVDEVFRVPSDSIEPPSEMIVTSHSEYLSGIVKLEGRLVILLDTDKVLSRDEYFDVLSSAEGARGTKKGKKQVADDAAEKPSSDEEAIAAAKGASAQT